jgi:hypothetical protein
MFCCCRAVLAAAAVDQCPPDKYLRDIQCTSLQPQLSVEAFTATSTTYIRLVLSILRMKCRCWGVCVCVLALAVFTMTSKSSRKMV